MLKPSLSFFVYRIQSKEKILKEKELFKERMELRIEPKRNESFLPVLTTPIKDPHNVNKQAR